ncbi:hypothetical protein [Rhizobium leguminosarum]|uniref:hypothetical protein n=1 Tax=Rhizobium leguminosarum TaxID=384 RepID=UPI0015E17345|nr:hypothetical protein [Rhizobium leguminosarum]KAF5885511.1 hypothetical protein FY112_11065 [Rhizobium sp. PEPV16]
MGPLGFVIAFVVSADGTGVSTSSAPELAAQPDRIMVARRIAGTADGRIGTRTQTEIDGNIHDDWNPPISNC